MKSKAQEIIEELSTQFALEADLTSDGVMKAIEARLKLFDIDGVQVDTVDIDYEGDIVVTFSDYEGDQLEVIFLVDDEDDSIVAIVNDDDDFDGSDEVLIVELTSLNPSTISIPGQADYVNLVDLSWMNRSTITSILSAGDIDFTVKGKSVEDGELPADKPIPQNTTTKNPHGYEEAYCIEEDAVMDEAGFARVVRGGKVVRLPLVRRKRRRILTGKVKAGIRRAALKRKAKAPQTKRKRARSLRLRRTQNVKRRTGNTNRLKVAGGADRKR